MLVPLFRGTAKVKVDGRVIPWVVVHTKRVDGVHLEIYVKKNAIPLGRVRSLGAEAYVDGSRDGCDVVQLVFKTTSDIKKEELKKILTET